MASIFWGRPAGFMVCIYVCSLLIYSANHKLMAKSIRPLTQIGDSLTAFSTIRADTDGDSIPDLSGKTVTVSGIANVSSGLFHEKYLQIFIQNDSSGLSIFGDKISQPVEKGDSLVVTGTVQQYYGAAEVHVASYQVFKHNSSFPFQAVELNLNENNYQPYEGMLVHARGIVVEKGNMFNGKYFSVAASDTSTKSLDVYVSNFHSRFSKFGFDKLSLGDRVDVRGILGQFDYDYPKESTFKIFLRTPNDLEFRGLPRFYITVFIVGLGIISLLVFGWIVLLKRQVNSRTEELEESLHEKELLLQEIHHRVKNNLAIVSGLLDLQLDTTLSPEAKQVLEESQTRIRSMALVHDKLYKSASLSRINMKSYIKELVQSIGNTFHDQSRQVEIKFGIDDIELEIEQVIPCGLLINELVVNAFKHAFNSIKGGILEVEMTAQNGYVKLRVADNGPGLPDDFSFAQNDSLGLMLIHTFANQLSSQIKINGDEGASFSFTFENTVKE